MFKKLKARAFIYYGITKEILKDDYETKRIIESGLGFLETPNLVDFENQKIKFDTDWYENGWFELMENIGIKDINGKEIFEGDIVKDTFGNIMIVEYKNLKWRLKCLNNLENSYILAFYYIDNSKECFDGEVIGNIFQKNVSNDENQLSEKELEFIISDIDEYSTENKKILTERLNVIVEKYYIEKYKRTGGKNIREKL
jgi:yopX protein